MNRIALTLEKKLGSPHLCKSSIYQGMWMCVAKRLSSDPRRAYEPVPNALVVYGPSPRHAYEHWLVYGKL